MHNSGIDFADVFVQASKHVLNTPSQQAFGLLQSGPLPVISRVLTPILHGLSAHIRQFIGVIKLHSSPGLLVLLLPRFTPRQRHQLSRLAMQRDPQRVRCERWTRIGSSPVLIASTVDAWQKQLERCYQMKFSCKTSDICSCTIENRQLVISYTIQRQIGF